MAGQHEKSLCLKIKPVASGIWGAGGLRGVGRGGVEPVGMGRQVGAGCAGPRGPGGDWTDLPGEGAEREWLVHKCWPRCLWLEWPGAVRFPGRRRGSPEAGKGHGRKGGVSMSHATEAPQGPELGLWVWQLWASPTSTRAGWGWGRPSWGCHWRSRRGEPAQKTRARRSACESPGSIVTARKYSPWLSRELGVHRL